MKANVLLLFLVIRMSMMAQPVRIHSHNDYRQTRPLQEALAQQVYSLEADIFLYKGQLRVAHDEAELPDAPTLDSLYIQPLLKWFKSRPADSNNYYPYLLIDIKSNNEAVLPALVKLLGANTDLFNPHQMQVVISGERGNPKDWLKQPGYVLFDGRPAESYDTATLRRVAFISDSYKNYPYPIRKNIKFLANTVHHTGKLLRLWGIPDHPDSWKKMKSWGVDIINTDLIRTCREYFEK